MSQLTKKRKESVKHFDFKSLYTIDEATALVKKISFTKFDASVDIAVCLGIDAKKSDQIVRGTVQLPHGRGKTVKVLVLCTEDKEEEAKRAGADYVGLETYLEKIEQGWVNIDVIIAMPSIMVKLGKLGKILGPRGLMPNPKTGTVTLDVGKAVEEVKAGKINFKTDKYGIVHASIGRVSFAAQKLKENIFALMHTIQKFKPATAKGIYIKNMSISSTMSAGIKVNKNSIIDV